jgi:hypothetical protein
MMRMTGWAICLTLGVLVRPARAQIGEIRVNTGIAAGLERGGLPAAVLGNASFSLVRSRLSLGPEVLYIAGDERVFGLGGVARVNLGTARFRPYVMASLGGNFWKQEDFGTTGLFSGSIGAGVGWGPSFTTEVRIYENLQRLASPADNWSFITLTGGVRLAWQ